MKTVKHLLTLALLVCLGTFASAQIPSYVPTNGLVGWWPFNGNANDESGNGNHGTVNGATLAADRFGNAGKAYYFSSNGCATHIQANVNTVSIRNGLTISIWISRSGQGCIGPRILEFGNNPTWNDGPGVAQWQWDNGNLTTFGSNTSSGFGAYFTFQPRSNNVWTNLTYTNDGAAAKFFQDGQLLNSIVSNGNPILDTSVAFGRMNHPANDAFNGLLDDIGIWNRALTAQEITNLYQGANVAAQEIQPSALQVYPNPANHEVTLQVLPHHLGKTVTVVNTLGQNVLQTQLQNERQTLSLGTLPAGVYTAFLNDDRRTTVKLIKE